MEHDCSSSVNTALNRITVWLPVRGQGLMELE